MEELFIGPGYPLYPPEGEAVPSSLLRYRYDDDIDDIAGGAPDDVLFSPDDLAAMGILESAMAFGTGAGFEVQASFAARPASCLRLFIRCLTRSDGLPTICRTTSRFKRRGLQGSHPRRWFSHLPPSCRMSLLHPC